MPDTPIHDWVFRQNRWRPFAFQRRAWSAYLSGGSGLIHAPTGHGKTYAAWLGPLMDWCQRHPDQDAWPDRVPLTVIWVTPLRALAADTVQALKRPVEQARLPWTVELRTGDTSSHLKQRQRKKPPSALVTTPESLTLLLSYADSQPWMSHLRCVVVDEWHELLSTKRGTQTELALARLRHWNPNLRTWGLSATLGNLEQARLALLGPPAEWAPPTETEAAAAPQNADQTSHPNAVVKPSVAASAVGGAHPAKAAKNTAGSCGGPSGGPSEGPSGGGGGGGGGGGVLISGEDIRKDIRVETVIPESMDRFPWHGHLGLHLIDQVCGQIERARTTLVFTNTRSQAELWYAELMKQRPQWLGALAIHHGSLEKKVRDEVEALLGAGRLKAVVCTSSLDLGVDFQPVDQVLQVGSPKGVARLMQRAGRSGHQPGATSTVIGVPAHAFELVEFAAARAAVAARKIEARPPLHQPLDVLAQHLVTCAMGGGFVAQELLKEVRSTYAFRALPDQAWRWCLDFAVRGGTTLTAYPQFARIKPPETPGGRYTVASRKVALNHRLGIGTITSDAHMTVALGNGKPLGSVEESFVAKLKPGDCFIFAGQVLEFVRTRGMTAHARRAKKVRGVVPRWGGGKSPLSTELADAVLRMLNGAGAASASDAPPEMRAVAPMLELQRRWSMMPSRDELLIEHTTDRRGDCWFVFPFAGRLVNEGLATLVGHRLARTVSASLTLTHNDYGFEIAGSRAFELSERQWRTLLSPEGLLSDLLQCLNEGELARRQFREVARVAGLLIPSYPGQKKAARHLQASSNLFFDVFSEFDPSNLLLDQARREVLDRQLEVQRLTDCLTRIQARPIVLRHTERLTPLAFPLWAESIRDQTISSESWSERLTRMVAQLEEAARPRG